MGKRLNSAGSARPSIGSKLIKYGRMNGLEFDEAAFIQDDVQPQTHLFLHRTRLASLHFFQHSSPH